MTTSEPKKGFEVLEILDGRKSHEFSSPIKRINDGADMSFWLTSRGYTDIMRFLLQLNVSMFSTKKPDGSVEGWPLDSKLQFSSTVLSIQRLLSELEKIIDEAPPDLGPRRFGNISFRKWYELVESRVQGLLNEHLPEAILGFSHLTTVTAFDELKTYFLGSFGSAQRLDYGTGHELSFLAFVGCIWKLGGFERKDLGVEERGIVIGIIEPYLRLIRRLISTYTLEPAGSHGVWGLDDHFFIPYIFGSAQLSPPINLINKPEIPAEGSLEYATKPSNVTKKNIVDRERSRNMYFSAIGFIYDVKKGPFWEHSPILFDVSGVTAGWAKINKGMIKMYNAEVLSKFPVVQHFPFGSLFRWEKDPEAAVVEASIHTRSQPTKAETSTSVPAPATRAALSGFEGTKAPWATGVGSSTSTSAQSFPASGPGMPPTRAPWVSTTPRPPPPPSVTGTSAPWATTTRMPPLPPPTPGTMAMVGMSASRPPPPATRTVPERPKDSGKEQ